MSRGLNCWECSYSCHVLGRAASQAETPMSRARTGVLLSVSIIGLLSGCASTPSTIPLQKALETLQSGLMGAGVTHPTDIIRYTTDSVSSAPDGVCTPTESRRHTSPQRDAALKSLQDAQRRYQMADPPIPMLLKEVSIALTVSSTEGGLVVVSMPPSGQLNGQWSQQQAFTVPLTFALLSSLPDVFYSVHSDYFKNLPKKTLDPAQECLAEMRTAMQAEVNQLITQFDQKLCSK